MTGNLVLKFGPQEPSYLFVFGNGPIKAGSLPKWKHLKWAGAQESQEQRVSAGAQAVL